MPPVVAEEVRLRAAKVKLVLMDVDGVLTDGRIFFLPRPDGGIFETKGFDSQDGIALQWLYRTGIKTGIISGRKSEATDERARTAHCAYAYTGHTEKLPIFEEILAHSKLQPEEIAYVGDDLTDAILMKRVGFAVAVANAKPEVKGVAHYVTDAAGGSGALREAAEVILAAQGLWSHILQSYDLES
jgi:3-deoxy-D-manno-octulosonate 8-phosphate phosphatase (KDO 8-P phosphatase)